MTIEEARKKIEQEFIDRYYQFLEDMRATKPDDREFGKKYGFFFVDPERVKKFSKDNQATLLYFQTNVFNGRWAQKWNAEGIDNSTLWSLKQSGFLSYSYYSNWNARATGRQEFYYISQATAKEIYKANKR